jgi:GTP diphosphokinase / guanosine-3',5'-bis(diphosphate) 3'-diphosphatase
MSDQIYEQSGVVVTALPNITIPINPTGTPSDPVLNPDASELMAKVRGYLSAADCKIIEKAVLFGAWAHRKQIRNSGEPYIMHPIAAAGTIADMQLDRDSIVATLLHDVPEDTEVTLAQVQDKFGETVARLVDGVTKLGRIKWDPMHDKATQEKMEQAENLRKMFLAMVDDVRVVLIKLADRLHNMQTLGFKKREKQIKIANETLEIFAPLANRLGIWSIKWQLEDLCFKYLQPEKYNELSELLHDKRDSLEKYIQRVTKTISKALEDSGIEIMDVSGRPKHIYSIHKKMMRKNRDLSQIYDVLAVRVLVNEVRDCYAALGIIHTLWRPIPGEFDDYIANPKESMYQSLHTAVFALDSRPLEVQIRTKEMHQVSEYGIAAHWRYKEGGKRDVEFEAKIAWLRRLIDWKDNEDGGERDAQEFVDTLKSDVFQDQVYVFTPNGDVIDLPAGATPLDFAYRIHTELGHTCTGARVNDRMVSLNYQLKNGEIVHIIKAKNRRGPSRDWLNSNSGYVKTAGARDKIKQWFRRQQRDENILHGKQTLDAELKRLSLELSYEAVAGHFPQYEKLDDFLAALGFGDVNTAQVTGRLINSTRNHATIPEFQQPAVGAVKPAQNQITSIEGLASTTARCCSPVPGDPIIGYVTKTKGLTVHRFDCPNVQSVPEKDRGRLIEVNWTGNNSYRVPVRVEAYDRVGLVRDISVLVAAENIFMSDFRTQHSNNTRGQIAVLFNVDVSDVDQLSRILHKLQSIADVIEVRRDVLAANNRKN